MYLLTVLHTNKSVWWHAMLGCLDTRVRGLSQYHTCNTAQDLSSHRVYNNTGLSNLPGQG